MIRFVYSLVIVLASSILFAPVACAEIDNVTISPRDEDAQGDAHYRLWLPEGVKQIRAIIVRQHGCGPGARKPSPSGSLL